MFHKCNTCRVQNMQYTWGHSTHSNRNRERGNSSMVSISVCQAGRPGSHPAWSACCRKVEFYHCAIELFPPVPTTGLTKAVHVLSRLWDYACKRSLAICRMSRHCVPLAGFCLSLYDLHALKQGPLYDSINKKTVKLFLWTGGTVVI